MYGLFTVKIKIIKTTKTKKIKLNCRGGISLKQNRISLCDCLTNSVYVAVRLIRIKIKPQMTSKCGKDKKSGTPGAAEFAVAFLTTF